ncbi:MAG: hypothetical protein RRA51_05985, partial [Armatimonadota bacterium]|nr:hypothetical protein [Armatimonadota bacterium]
YPIQANCARSDQRAKLRRSDGSPQANRVTVGVKNMGRGFSPAHLISTLKNAHLCIAGVPFFSLQAGRFFGLEA